MTPGKLPPRPRVIIRVADVYIVDIDVVSAANATPRVRSPTEYSGRKMPREAHAYGARASGAVIAPREGVRKRLAGCHELERHRVDAIAQTRGRRAVGEDVALVRIAP